jgi:hypothetical protein
VRLRIYINGNCPTRGCEYTLSTLYSSPAFQQGMAGAVDGLIKTPSSYIYSGALLVHNDPLL